MEYINARKKTVLLKPFNELFMFLSGTVEILINKKKVIHSADAFIQKKSQSPFKASHCATAIFETHLATISVMQVQLLSH